MFSRGSGSGRLRLCDKGRWPGGVVRAGLVVKVHCIVRQRGFKIVRRFELANLAN